MKLQQYIVFGGILTTLLLASCANRGQGPQGGPRDSIPPLVMKETPLNGTLNFTGKEIIVQFDEYIQLDDVQKNVLISPPQQTPPEVKAIGKKLSVVFQEDLIDSTTYTLDFGPAICDYNEKVPLEGYVFSFSTGDVIDSLAISGKLYDAATLNPMPFVIVGIHRNLSDSALSTIPFTRITRTDSEGNFIIHNITAGTYRLYALNDISRDYIYQPGEALAYADSLIVPSCRIEEHTDTIWKDTLGIDLLTGDTLFTRLVDSTYTHQVTHFYPDSLILWCFEESKQRRYFQRVFREEQHVFSLVFSAPQDTLPIIRALRPSEVDSLGNDSSWVDFLQHSMLQASFNKDTLTFWLTDSLAIGMDSIYLQMQYKVTDSLYNLVDKIDTVLAVYRHPRLSEKARETYERNKRNRKLELKTNASSKFEIYDTIQVLSDFPIDSLNDDMFHLWQKVDTILKPMAVKIEKKDSMAMEVYIMAKLLPEASYQLKIDSAACIDIYGTSNDSIEATLKLKSKEEYSSLTVKLESFDSLARIQLLNDKDVVIRELPATNDGAKFEYLAPTTYYLRLYIDLDGDGKWTTGDWLLKRQPEPIYYFPKKLKLRANWDFEENFDHLAIPRTNSKPKALVGKDNKKKR
ncbi:MAG: Ig-like domain-containing protein [Paludibacteraceae bacterium]|nr:Ig-like domain-containing protein [Paludibacteraceae bacterium]